ncbi:MAG: FtsX-like permease family protein [Acidobacteria bacterium]|nr:FtsX-like permease family protein [Acidobacteriota bacterium]MSO61264.1 FtsX-like permease family protein [Acidobacteriota bacterium]
MKRSLVAADAARAASLVPTARVGSPVVSRYLKIGRAEHLLTGQVLGITPAFQQILRLGVARGRFISETDESAVARVAVIGAGLARQLFGFRDPLADTITIAADHYRVVGVLREQGTDPQAGSTMAWHNINGAAFVPLPTLTGHTFAVAPNQPVDEVWIQVAEGERSEELGEVFRRVLLQNREADEFTIVVPRELLAQRYRTQRTFSVVVGSVAALALLVGGIGIMNIMLTSVVERTREIGVRRTVGARRRDVTMQFLVETLLMTVGGGVVGIAVGAVVSAGSSAYAGWSTHVSTTAVALGFFVSVSIGILFGLYPAMKAAALEPVDAMRHE